MFRCIHYSPACPRVLFTERTSWPKVLVLTLTFQQCLSTSVEQSLVLAWALYNAALFLEEVFSANISFPTNKESGECTCHQLDPLPLKWCHHSRAAEHQSCLFKYWCHHTFFQCPFVIILFLYFLPVQTRISTLKSPQKSQCFLIIQLIKNKKQPILIKFQLLPILSHWLIHKTVIEYQPYSRKQILPSNTDMIMYNMIYKTWHMKVISEIRKDLQKKWREEVMRNRKGRKSFYLEIQMWTQTSGTGHLGFFWGTWKEEHKIHGRK